MYLEIQKQVLHVLQSTAIAAYVFHSTNSTCVVCLSSSFEFDDVIVLLLKNAVVIFVSLLPGSHERAERCASKASTLKAIFKATNFLSPKPPSSKKRK